MSTKRKKIRVIQSTVFNTNWQINFKRGWGDCIFRTLQNYMKMWYGKQSDDLADVKTVT